MNGSPKADKKVKNKKNPLNSFSFVFFDLKNYFVSIPNKDPNDKEDNRLLDGNDIRSKTKLDNI